jgi:phosphatidylserine synthase 2
MMIIRDVKMCWLCSIVFELLEITFRHWLPNFWECWWDHLLLDVFGCNMIGIILGAYSCNYLYVRRMNWLNKPHNLVPPCQSKIKTLINKFKPNVWTRYEWSVFQNVKRYNQILFYCFVCLGIDCMNFFLKFILWIPADHKILSVRLFLWATASIACSKEFYEFITNPHCKRVGAFFWIAAFALGIEFSIAIKFGSHMFVTPFPWYVQAMWAVIGGLVLLGQIYSFINQIKSKVSSD